MFGARGAATMLSKATTIFGGLFMVTSLTLTLLGAGRTTQPRSIVTEEAQRAPVGVPSQSAPPGAVPSPLEGPAGPALPAADDAAPPPSGDAGAPEDAGAGEGP
jgi:hypothetical protein